MKTSNIIEIQKKIGATPDGFWGPKSTAACQSYLRSLMPSPSPWPKPDKASLRAFYGDPWDNSQIVMIEAPEWLRLYDSDKPVTRIQVHERCADSLLQCLLEAYEVAPVVVSRFFGCHVDRNMRGGSLPSLHAYGAAVDLDANMNGNHDHWPQKATMPLEVMEVFCRHGWTPAGAFWSRDGMHFAAHQPD